MDCLNIIPYPEFPDRYFIVDAVQEINRPYYEFIEAAPFLQVNTIYCMKSQVVINLKGLAVDITISIPGSELDKSNFDINISIFKQNFTSNFQN